MRTGQLTIRWALPLLVLGGLTLAGCGDDTATDSTSEERPVAVEDDTTERRPVPRATEFPRFDDLSAEAAEATLHGGLDDLGFDYVSRDLLLYLVKLGDRRGVNAVHSELLAQEGGVYEDLELAATGLEILDRYGEDGTDARILELAAVTFEEDELTIALPRALAQVEGDEAIEWLERCARETDDDDVAWAAVHELARRRAPSAELFHELATSEDHEDGVRGAAFAGLIALGDPRVDALIPVLTDDDNVDLVGDVVYGMAVEGLHEVDPVLRRMLEELAAAEDVGFVPDEVCAALPVIYEFDAPDDVLRYMHELEHDERFEATTEDAAIARWKLGDDTGREAAREVLRQAVVNAQNGQDTEDALEILEALARRGQARDPAWMPLVSAAAQVRPDADVHPSLVHSADILNVAAAYAFLASGE